MKRKAFVIDANPNGESLEEMNELLAKGWKVLEVHPSNGQHTFWFVTVTESEQGSVASAR